MLSKIPIDLERIRKDDQDKEILRSAIIAELDAINLYEQMADMTRNANIRKVLLDIAREEKTHMGEFQALLLIEDRKQVQNLEEGKKEVQELLIRKKSSWVSVLQLRPSFTISPSHGD
jgi:rubrerythrin